MYISSENMMVHIHTLFGGHCFICLNTIGGWVVNTKPSDMGSDAMTCGMESSSNWGAAGALAA